MKNYKESSMPIQVLMPLGPYASQSVSHSYRISCECAKLAQAHTYYEPSTIWNKLNRESSIEYRVYQIGSTGAQVPPPRPSPSFPYTHQLQVVRPGVHIVTFLTTRTPESDTSFTVGAAK